MANVVGGSEPHPSEKLSRNGTDETDRQTLNQVKILLILKFVNVMHRLRYSLRICSSGKQVQQIYR